MGKASSEPQGCCVAPTPSTGSLTLREGRYPSHPTSCLISVLFRSWQGAVILDKNFFPPPHTLHVIGAAYSSDPGMQEGWEHTGRV